MKDENQYLAKKLKKLGNKNVKMIAIVADTLENCPQKFVKEVGEI